MNTKIAGECQKCQDKNAEHCNTCGIRIRLKLIDEIEGAIARKHAKYGWKNTGNPDQDIAG